METPLVEMNCVENGQPYSMAVTAYSFDGGEPVVVDGVEVGVTVQGWNGWSLPDPGRDAVVVNGVTVALVRPTCVWDMPDHREWYLAGGTSEEPPPATTTTAAPPATTPPPPTTTAPTTTAPSTTTTPEPAVEAVVEEALAPAVVPGDLAAPSPLQGAGLALAVVATFGVRKLRRKLR